MTLLALSLANLRKHPLRLLLTGGALAVAVFLLCVLRSLVVALDAGVREAKSNRLIVQSAVSLFVSLPEAYQEKIAGVPGVQQVTKWQWFGAYYQSPKNFFAQFAVDPAGFLESYPELEIVEGSTERFLVERTACLVGYRTMDRFGWKVGDSVPLIGTIFPRADNAPWEFQITGVYRSRSPNLDESTLFFPYEYLRQSLESGAASGPEGTGVFSLLLAPGADPVTVMSQVDALFENGPQRVQTTTEAEFNAQFVSMIGNVPFFVSSIGGGVLIAIVLAVINTMLLAGREQTPDVGVLKALGFSDGAVFGTLLAQSLLLCVVGGGLGIGLAVLSSDGIAGFLSTMFPGYRVTQETLVQAGVLTLGIGLVAGIVPAARAGKLTVIQALRREI